jgi:hypothetical protein
MNLLDAVTRRLERLRAVLADLGRQARDRLAGAVGQAVAAAVEDAVHAALEPPGGGRPGRPWPPAADAWHDPLADDLDGYHDADLDPWGLDPAPAYRQDAAEGDAPPTPVSRWRQALAVGARAYGWAAERLPACRVPGLPLLVAAALAVLTYWAGPGPGLLLAAVTAAMNLAGLADAPAR